ncbi:VCBS repeat-containing protein, partial [bacterium]|nr:VCBS repeat-containing protein [bacterium]
MRALSFGDFDNDGDLDLLVSGEYEMGMPIGKCMTKIYRNDNGKFVEYPTNLVGVDSKNVGWVDIDHDGDLDIYVFGLSGYDEDYQQLNASKIYINNNGVFTEKEFPIKIYSGDGIAWGDYDNDGDLDLALSGSSAFGIYYTKVYENRKGLFVEKANL